MLHKTDPHGERGDKDKMKDKYRNLPTVLFWLYIAAVLRITVFRPGFLPVELLKNGSINLTLFQGYVPLLKKGDWFRFLYLFVGNIIWFVPFGMYLEHKSRGNSLWKIVLAGFLFSLTIESLQYLFGTGYSELDDLILNTAGVFAGAVFVKGVKRHVVRGGGKPSGNAEGKDP